MEKQIYKFTNEINTLEVSSLGAKIILKANEADEFKAEYSNPKDSPEFCAVLNGTTLSFKEKLSFSLFCPKPKEDYTIEVFVPKKKLAKLKISTASGGADIGEVTAEEFELSTASGSIEINAAFDSVRIQSASGSVKLTAPETITAKSLSVCTVSGKAEISNYKSEEYSLHSVSGKTSCDGISGKGKISVTSGNIDVTYNEWNADLDISAISGKINVALPEGSGIDVKFDGVSGLLRTDIGMEKGQLMNFGKGTSGALGGDNRHKLNISLTSGNVQVVQQ